MAICAYCGEDKRPTREHVFPAFMLRRRTSYRTFVDHSRSGMVVKSPPTVRDVCAECNGGVLSVLDAYVKTLDDQFFGTYVETSDSVGFEYSYEELLRWLLKVCYNDARASNGSVKEHQEFAKYILGLGSPPKPIDLFLGVIAPVTTTLAEQRGGLGKIAFPPAVRLGRLKLHASAAVALDLHRLVSINSYLSVFLVWKPQAEELIRRATIRALTGRGFELLTPDADSVMISSACTDVRKFLSIAPAGVF
jgi:hypothetical protein